MLAVAAMRRIGEYAMFGRELSLGRKFHLAVTLPLTLLFCLLSTASAAAQTTLSSTTF
jgi:hypothetical protein